MKSRVQHPYSNHQRAASTNTARRRATSFLHDGHLSTNVRFQVNTGRPKTRTSFQTFWRVGLACTPQAAQVNCRRPGRVFLLCSLTRTPAAIIRAIGISSNRSMIDMDISYLTYQQRACFYPPAKTVTTTILSLTRKHF